MISLQLVAKKFRRTNSGISVLIFAAKFSHKWDEENAEAGGETVKRKHSSIGAISTKRVNA